MSQFERNYKLLISKDVTADATSVATLDSGELVVLKPDGTLLTAGETISDAEYIIIAQGTNTANAAATGYLPKLSAKIYGSQVKKWTGQSYAAAVEQSSTLAVVGAGVGSAATEDTTYTVHIVIKNDKVSFSERQLRKSFSYVNLEGATVANNTALATALFNVITSDDYFDTAANPKPNAYIRVTDGGAGTLTFAGKALATNSIDDYEQVNFEIIDGENITGSTVTYGTKPSQGVGTPKKVKDLEKLSKANEGLTNFRKWPIPTGVDTEVLDTEKYDIYVIEHDDVHPSADLNGQIASPLKTIIAVPYDAAAGNGNALEALLNPYFASCPGAFANINL